MPWSASVLVITTSPFDSGRHVELSRPSRKSLGGSTGKQAELVLPAEAVGLELGQQVEHGQVHAQAASCVASSVKSGRACSRQWKLTPLSLTKRKASVDALRLDSTSVRIGQPGLIDLVLGEAVA